MGQVGGFHARQPRITGGFETTSASLRGSPGQCDTVKSRIPIDIGRIEMRRTIVMSEAEAVIIRGKIGLD